jgi:hypothetical protein
MTSWLDPVRAALDHLAAPRTFFFRDDDVGWGSDRLFPLLDLFLVHGVPLDLAVIPAELTPALARQLLLRAAHARGRLGFHQHGWCHANHEPTGRNAEFGPSHPRQAQLTDIRRGQERLTALLGLLVEPMFTPPWNRCTRETGECLLQVGLRILSREWRAPALGLDGLDDRPIRIDWLAKRHGVRYARREVAGELVAAIAGAGPVGIMLHHAAQTREDDAELAELVVLLARHPRARCLSMRELPDAANGVRTLRAAAGPARLRLAW